MMRRIFYRFLIPVLLGGGLIAAPAQTKTREVVPLMNWEFTPDKSPAGEPQSVPELSGWSAVKVPHIFRQSGLKDDMAGWYRWKFTPSASDAGRRLHLVLEGAASVKDVFVNGRKIGRHVGAFTASVFDLTPAVKPGGVNEILVRVSNRDEEVKGTLSRSTLYFVNGGMFRKASLVKTGAVHIFPESGSSGVFISPVEIKPESVRLNVSTFVRNPLDRPVDVVVRHTVTGPDGEAAGSFESRKKVSAGDTVAIKTTGVVERPKLWDLHQPNLYTVRTDLLADGKMSDAVTVQTGFRTIAMKDNRFLLNGREVQFRGANKHEQTEREWNAVGDEGPVVEWKAIMDMGGNAVRLAHYPHSQLEYSLADKNGIAVWAENGFAGHAWKGASEDDKPPTADGERLTREMVRQNWNHPSILFWSAGNESVPKTVERYAEVIRGEDPDRLRLVTYASNGPDPKNCDFIARNTYDGWYGKGHYTGFAELPRNAFISETGAGDWVTHHVPYGMEKWSVDKFEPGEYAEMFTEYRLQTVCRNEPAARPMFFWWNFREFYDRKFKANRNTKGLLTLAGKPKDLYFLFQAFLNPEKPVVHLNGRNHFLRKFAPDNGIKAYSNAKELTLTVNGTGQGKLRNGEYRLPDTTAKDGSVKPGIPIENVFFWKIPLKAGRNVIEVADGRGNSDSMVIYQQPAEGSMPSPPDAIVQNLASSNPDNPAVFIDRPIEGQGSFYSEVDGTSDNTFDALPPGLEGDSWIATRRLSDQKNRTDLSFTINPASKGAIISVLFSAGTFPVFTLEPASPTGKAAAAGFAESLASAGFSPTKIPACWRNHDLILADAHLWSRRVDAGAAVSIPGGTLDYVVLIRPADGRQPSSRK